MPEIEINSQMQPRPNFLEAEIIGHTVRDVVLTGIVLEKNGVTQFVPNYGRIYFILDVGIIEFREVEVDLSMVAAMVSEIGFDEDFQDDEKPGKISIGHVVLLDTLMRNQISKVQLYGVRNSDRQEIRFNGISIFLDSNNEIFLDSCGTLGLNIGGEAQRKLWLQNSSQFPGYDVDATLLM